MAVMIKMARLTEYGFMLIMALKKSSQPVSAEYLAQTVGLEVPTVSKILKQLRKAGLLDSKRGAHGGYFLMKRKDRKSTRLNSSHVKISYAVFCLKKKK